MIILRRLLLMKRNVKPYLDEIRDHIDKLELIVDNEMWPLRNTGNCFSPDNNFRFFMVSWLGVPQLAGSFVYNKSIVHHVIHLYQYYKFDYFYSITDYPHMKPTCSSSVNTCKCFFNMWFLLPVRDKQ